jgi:hypothetical protein
MRPAVPLGEIFRRMEVECKRKERPRRDSSPVAWHLLRHFPTVGTLHTAGLTALGHSLRHAGIRFPQRTVMSEPVQPLHAAIGHEPTAAQAKPLQEELPNIPDGQRRGPRELGDIWPIVLARWGVVVVQSPGSGEETSVGAGSRAENDFSPRGEPSDKPGALWDHQRLRRHRGVTPLIDQEGEKRLPQTSETGSWHRIRYSRTL